MAEISAVNVELAFTGTLLPSVALHPFQRVLPAFCSSLTRPPSLNIWR